MVWRPLQWVFHLMYCFYFMCKPVVTNSYITQAPESPFGVLSVYTKGTQVLPYNKCIVILPFQFLWSDHKSIKGISLIGTYQRPALFSLDLRPARIHHLPISDVHRSPNIDHTHLFKQVRYTVFHGSYYKQTQTCHAIDKVSDNTIHTLDWDTMATVTVLSVDGKAITSF